MLLPLTKPCTLHKRSVIAGKSFVNCLTVDLRWFLGALAAAVTNWTNVSKFILRVEIEASMKALDGSSEELNWNVSYSYSILTFSSIETLLLVLTKRFFWRIFSLLHFSEALVFCSLWVLLLESIILSHESKISLMQTST